MPKQGLCSFDWTVLNVLDAELHDIQDSKHRLFCSGREQTELPLTIVADQRTRDRLVMSMELRGPVEQLEKILCAEREVDSDPRDGVVLWVLDVPSPRDPTKIEVYAMKRYEP